MLQRRFGSNLLLAVILLLIDDVEDFCKISSSPSSPKINTLVQEEQQFKRRVETIRAHLKILRQKIRLSLLPPARKELLMKRTYRIANKLEKIYTDYFETSAAHVILGPFGALSHIMDEQQLEHQLLALAQEIKSIISQIIFRNMPALLNKSSTEIDQVLEHNMRQLMI